MKIISNKINKEERNLLGIFSLRISTYFRYVLLVFLMYGSFILVSLYVPYLVKGTIQNLIFWFFLLAIFDQVFIAIENFLNKNAENQDNKDCCEEEDENKKI